MKKGQFCELFDVTPSTVRFYIDSGLLIPKRENNQYVFSKDDINEMELIKKLHNLSFQNSEIKEYLKIYRMYSHSDSTMNTHIKKLISNKISELETNILDLTNQSNFLKQELKALPKLKNTSNELDFGLSIDFLNIIACPECNCSLKLINAQIENSQISNGELLCNCGYTIPIEDGILIVENELSEFYRSHTFEIQHYSREPRKDADFVLFEHMNEINSEAVVLFQKSYAWGNMKLHSLPNSCERKVIFVPDLSNHFLYKNIHEPYFQDALIIISGFTKKNVTAIKNHINRLNPNLKVMYVSNTIFKLPVKKKCIDIWIDMISSYNFSFFHTYSLSTKVKEYLKPDSHIIGLTKYYNPGSVSLSNIEEFFTNSMKKNSLLSTFKKNIADSNFNLLDDHVIGVAKDPGPYYNYHHLGEEHVYYTFHLENLS